LDLLDLRLLLELLVVVEVGWEMGHLPSVGLPELQHLGIHHALDLSSVGVRIERVQICIWT